MRCSDSQGDARKLLNILELTTAVDGDEKVVITDKLVTERLQENPAAYDKGAKCTTISFRHLSNRYGEAIPMRRYIGWHEW